MHLISTPIPPKSHHNSSRSSFLLVQWFESFCDISAYLGERLTTMWTHLMLRNSSFWTLNNCYLQLARRALCKSFKPPPEGCSLPAVEYKEKIDYCWYSERQQKLRRWPFLTDRRICGYAGRNPNSDQQSNKCENMCVPRKPESRAPPKDKETYSADR